MDCKKIDRDSHVENPPPFAPLDQPPAYDEVEAQAPAIPSLNLRRDAGKAEITTVTPDQCAAHLKFLAALADLRDQVASNNGLFGIPNPDANQSESKLRARVREKRWAVYTARAVERYRAWWNNCVPDLGTRPTIETLQDTGYSHITACEDKLDLNPYNIPPLGE